MRTKTLLILLTGLLVAAEDPKETAKKEIDKLQGTWTTASVVYNGKDYADGKGKIKFVFKGEQATVQANAKIKKEYAKLVFKLDPSTDPKIVDITVADGVQKDTVIEGIYEMKDGEMRLCAKVFGKDRPTKFESTEGSGIVVVVLRRDKE
jgi:uncharacterized protein (TIGR03067 family)